MDKIVAVCGITCTECPAYQATQTDDDALRAKTAEEWSKMYGSDIKAEHINCDGCNTEGKKIHHCTECEIRLCGLDKGHDNCGQCADYACEKLEGFFGMVPDAKTTLDQIHNSRITS
jgi:hypothetical protein